MKKPKEQHSKVLYVRVTPKEHKEFMRLRPKGHSGAAFARAIIMSWLFDEPIDGFSVSIKKVRR